MTTLRADLSFFIIVGVMVAVPLVYLSTFSGLVTTWQNDGFEHCAFVPLLSTYLLWQRRQIDRVIVPSAELAGLLFLFSWAVAWLLARKAQFELFEQLALVGLIHGAVWSFLGWRVLRANAFPLGFLFLAVPMGIELVPWLMDKTATVSTSLLVGVGLSVLREGLLIHTSSGSFEVAVACSGFNYLYSGIMISSLMAYLCFRTFYAGVLFVGFSALVYVVLNFVRATLVIYLATITDMRWFVGDDHIVLGWVLFGCTILVQAFVARALGTRRQARLDER